MPPLTKVKPRRACHTCHIRKIRCDRNATSPPHEPCNNCRDSGIECKPHVRKRKRDTLQAKCSLEKEDHDSQLLPTEGMQTVPREPSYLGRSKYLAAHIPINEEDASQYQEPGQARECVPAQEVALTSKLWREDTIPKSVRESLIQSFRTRCKPWMPLIDENELCELSQCNNEGSLLLNAVLVAGSIVSTAPRAAEYGEKCYQRAKVMFYSGREQNTLKIITATIFLQWYNPNGPEHVSIDNSSFWLRTGVALAHQIGLHRQPDTGSTDGQLRRKLWWTLVSRDSQIATSHGRPRAINMLDSNVAPLEFLDFAVVNDEALLFMVFVTITTILGDLTEACLRGALNSTYRIHIEGRLQQWVEKLPPQFHLHIRDTKLLTPYNFRVRQLHVPYFVALIILSRQGVPDRRPSGLGLLAASFISGIYEEYLDWEDLSHVPPAAIFYLLVASLEQISAHRFASLSSSREKEVGIRELALHELKKRFPTALGAERVIRNVSKLSQAAPMFSTQISLSISTEQERFITSFGSELCRQWHNVLSKGTDTVNASSVSNLELSNMGQLQEDGGVSPGNSNQVEDDNGWVNFLPQVNHETNLELDIIPSDTVGQWFWSDWMP